MMLVFIIFAILLFLTVLWLRSERQKSERVGTTTVVEKDSIQQAKEQHGKEAEQKIAQHLRTTNTPHIKELFLQNKKYSSEIDFVALINRSLWVIEVKGWSGHTSGHRNQNNWKTEKKSQGGQVYTKDRSNAFSQIYGHASAVSRLARKPAPRIIKALVVCHGTIRIEQCNKNEIVLNEKEFLKLLQNRNKSTPKQKTNKLWNKLKKIHQETDPVLARRKHLEIAKQRRANNKKN